MCEISYYLRSKILNTWYTCVPIRYEPSQILIYYIKIILLILFYTSKIIFLNFIRVYCVNFSHKKVKERTKSKNKKAYKRQTRTYKNALDNTKRIQVYICFPLYPFLAQNTLSLSLFSLSFLICSLLLRKFYKL